LEESGALANKKQQLRDRLISLRSTALIRYAPRVTKQIQKRWTTQGASARCRGAEVGDQRSQGPASCEGLRPRRLHTIEHAQVSQFIAAGMNILTISRRLGHTSAAITLRIYSRRFANTDARAAEIMEATFAKVQTEQEHSGGNPVAIAPGKG
jgi:integrase